ncbi:MAG TPA: NAD(P)/FAD-dependent oxidoreductase [Thermoplasmata archaeon]|nr:NAD(P)/FAD-dependent oxidoreductase [Thermoplasmata archaeon]
MPGLPRLKESYDLVVVGGGHAGLQAGLKAALLHHTAAVLDRGPKYARSFYAPVMDNIPGFPGGVSGHALLDKQVAQVRAVDARVGYFTPSQVHAVRKVDGGFDVEFDWLRERKTVRGRGVVFAMGVVDRMLQLNGDIKPIFPWANFGIVDFCILCDGHLMEGKSIGVLGADRFAVLTALDLLEFEPSSVEILTHGRPLLADVDETERSRLANRLAEHHVTHVESPIVKLDGIREKKFVVGLADGTTRSYDKGFSALGWWDLHHEIPKSLGATIDRDGFVRVDEDCRILDASGAPIPGLYCVGDQKTGWNQIPEAWASAERAVIHAYAEYL